MDSSYRRSRRRRPHVTCRRRGVSLSTDTSDSDGDAEDDHELGSGLPTGAGACISPGWPGNIRRRFRFSSQYGQFTPYPREPMNRTRVYRTRERSRSPVTPSPPGTRLVSPAVSLSRIPQINTLITTGRIPWAPNDWTEDDPLDAETVSIMNTHSSTDDPGDSDSYTPPTTIRIVRRTTISADEDEDEDNNHVPVDDEDDPDDDVFTQAVEDIQTAAALELFDTSADEDDEEMELAEMYGVSLDQDYSETGEGTLHPLRQWSIRSGATTPSASSPSDDEDGVNLLQQAPSQGDRPIPQQDMPSTSTSTTTSSSMSMSNQSARSVSLPTITNEDGPLAGTLMELLECPVCYEPMQPPIWQCSRGHLVCRDCAPKLRRCPTCRCGAQRTRNCTLEKVSSALRYPCRNRHRGCVVHLPPSQLSIHEDRECSFRDASCRVQSCNWRGEPSAASAHARAAHAALTRILQLGRPVIMGLNVPTSTGQRVTRVLRLVDSDRIFCVHLQLNSSSNVAQWCSYVQEFGGDPVNPELEYRLDLDEEGAAEKRLVRPNVVNEVVALIIRGNGKIVDTRSDDNEMAGQWTDRAHRARVYSPTEIADEAPGSSRSRCYSYSQIKKGFYISNSGSIKARIAVTLWSWPLIHTGHDSGDNTGPTPVDAVH